MREILFRGKDTETGTWLYGGYIHLHRTTYCCTTDYENDKNNDIHQIVYERMTDWGLPNNHLRTDVIPATVGQYTGLTDKNGKKIFEGDIVDVIIYPTDGESEETHKRGVVVWDAEDCAFEIEHKDGTDGFWWYTPSSDIEVVGNIHDNPGLMEQGENT